MEKMYKRDAEAVLSQSLGVPRTRVKEVVDSYCEYVENSVAQGNPRVGFLGLCVIAKEGEGLEPVETMGFQMVEVMKSTGYSYAEVDGILRGWKSLIVDNLRLGVATVVYGLLSVTPSGDKSNRNVTFTKSGSLRSSDPVRVRADRTLRMMVKASGVLV